MTHIIVTFDRLTESGMSANGPSDVFSIQIRNKSDTTSKFVKFQWNV